MKQIFFILFFILTLSKQLFSSTIVDSHNLDGSTAPRGIYLDSNKYLTPFGTSVAFGISSIIDTTTSDIQNPLNLNNLINPNKYVFNDYYFSNNSINLNFSIAGGVMFIENNIANDIQILNSTFIKNKIQSNISSLVGGAIASFLDKNFSLNISNSNFIENSINHTSPTIQNPNIAYLAGGGAIFTTTKLNINNSVFEKNSVSSVGYQSRGGAISNYGGETTIKDTSFFNNFVASSNNEAIGGAISNTQKNDTGAGGLLNIIAENKNVIFSGNTMQGTNTAGAVVGNDIYNKGNSILNLNANNGRSIIFNSGIDGDGSSVININNGVTNNKGSIVLNSSIKNNSVNIFGGIISFVNENSSEYFINAPLTIEGDVDFSLQNNKINFANFGNITSNNKKIFLLLDVDLQSKAIDSIEANILSLNFKFNFKNFYVIKDSIGERVDIDLKDVISGSLTVNNLNYDDDFPTTSSGILYNYKLELNKTTDILTFIRLSFNPYLYNQTISMRETFDFQRYLTQSILDRNKISFVSSIQKLVLSDRIKYRSQAIKHTEQNNNIIFNLVRVDTRADAFRLARGEAVYGVLAQLEETNIEKQNKNKKSIWFDAFGLKDTSKYNHFSSIKNDFFTILLGMTSKTKFLNKNSKIYNNIYLGYLKGNQKYTESRIENNGAYVGATGFYEYKKFIASISGNIGLLDNNANNQFGTDNYKNYWFSIGTKFAYNHKFGNSGYFLEPALYISYIFATSDNYKTKSNIKLEQNDLNSFQISPSLQMTKLFKKNLTVSIKTKYVFEMINDLELNADNILLPELTNDPFIEYGLSLDKKIKDNFALNIELNRRDGGKRGWVGGLNARLYF